MYIRKRLSALLLSWVLAFTLSAPAFAAVGDTDFSDVDAGAWYAEAVMYCREHNLMAGTGNNQFAPEDSLTRAQLATVLYRIEGAPTVTEPDAFTDTAEETWYSDAVAWASQQNIMTGYGGGLFGPNDPVSREQMTTTLWRYAGSPAAVNATNYSDETAIASYATAAVDWASANMHALVPKAGDVYSNIPLRPEWRLADSQISVKNTCIDYGEEEFTKGRPHPAIDPSVRKPAILREAGDRSAAVILLDFILTPPGHMDPVGYILDDVCSPGAGGGSTSLKFKWYEKYGVQRLGYHSASHAGHRLPVLKG